MRVAVVPAPRAEQLRRELHRAGVVDRTVRMAKRDGMVWIPLRADPPVPLDTYGARLDEADGFLPRRRVLDPRAALSARLHHYGVPPTAHPRKWARLGEVVVVRLPEAAQPYAPRIGAALAEVLDARAVVEERAGIHGVHRTPEVRILWGRGLEVLHTEGGVRYLLDVAKIMFSSGNLPERTSIPAKVTDGAVVVDLFAGIGYFTLPIAVHARPAHVYACEINPVAFHYLVENLRLNRVTHVTPLFGDCRVTAPQGVADVVLMGHFSAPDYLDVALASLRSTGTIVLHELCPREQFPDGPVARLTGAARSRWYDVESVRSRILKSYAPGIVHVVLEARVVRRPKG